MDILIPDSWLRDFLRTKANTKQIADYLSLCGPSVERVEKKENDSVYSIEVTTNRVDAASVYGIAREAAAILPRFGIKAHLQPIKLPDIKFSNKVSYLDAKVDYTLCFRFCAVLIKNVVLKESPIWMKEKLLAVGVRPINNVVDISNYIMHEIGQPVHTFDYDKILGSKMTIRESKKGEKLTTLDGKSHSLLGGDIVIEDGSGRLIDLAGIMGGENSAIDEKSKNVLLFVQTYNPVNIRKTSMGLAQRTEAAVLFEKSLDPELVTVGIKRGIELFAQLTEGKAETQVLDLYPNPYSPKKVSLDLDFITQRLGTPISKQEITKYLNSLDFEVSWKGKALNVFVPSYRVGDVEILEDIVEEVARIYGYYNLPSEIMPGIIPDPLLNSPFEFEQKIKEILSGWGGVETYTLSLVSKNEVSESALKLKNPLGSDSEYLRVSLMPSLIRAAKENSGYDREFHLFEIANVYIPVKGNLPNEKMTLAGIFSKYNYREAKGIIESLLNRLNIDVRLEAEDKLGFLPSKRLVVKSGGKVLGEFGITLENFIYYEFEVEELRKGSHALGTYESLPKYPPQVEDLTFSFPQKTKIGEVISFIKTQDKLIASAELKDIYKDAYTITVLYQHPTKTLTNKEVEGVREKIIKAVENKFGGRLKE